MCGYKFQSFASILLFQIMIIIKILSIFLCANVAMTEREIDKSWIIMLKNNKSWNFVHVAAFISEHYITSSLFMSQKLPQTMGDILIFLKRAVKP